MDSNLPKSAEKRTIHEVSTDDAKMETDNALATNTANTSGPKRKKIKKHKNDIDKSPLMLFNETFPATEFILESSSGPSHDPEFVMSVSLDGVKYEGRARSKKDAKQKVAESILRSKSLWPVQHGLENVDQENVDGMILSSTADQVKKPTREAMIVQAVTEGRNAVSVVNQYHPEAKFTIVGEVGKSHSKVFTSELTLNDKTYLGNGSNKKAANICAAARALFQLYGVIHCTNNEDVSAPTDLQFLVPQPLADKIGEMVLQKLAQLSESNDTPNLRRKVLAGIVKTVQKGEEVVEMDVISLGTGTKCISGGNISNSGLALNDCHGEVIARRGFCHYLYEQLDLALKGKVKVSCFTKKKSGLYALKDGVAFHLYISTSPCGDGRIFSPKEKIVDEPDDRHPQRKTRGLLRTKIENGEVKANYVCGHFWLQ
ncbi:double-stranded RNA-specific editase 1-like isoform X2 [Dendronephthya gigantea]|uniref:double-stranded RNA-specific editase 1-like isoform X2 n=1 Tax=Dendronephthya gigantea TaxID=151771 RepID=UPI00106B4953|nr:double-stranded RNA-specific editase 1-like isoform X2 [Dendronephthya gigantea]